MYKIITKSFQFNNGCNVGVLVTNQTNFLLLIFVLKDQILTQNCKNSKSKYDFPNKEKIQKQL